MCAAEAVSLSGAVSCDCCHRLFMFLASLCRWKLIVLLCFFMAACNCLSLSCKVSQCKPFNQMSLAKIELDVHCLHTLCLFCSQTHLNTLSLSIGSKSKALVILVDATSCTKDLDLPYLCLAEETHCCFCAITHRLSLLNAFAFVIIILLYIHELISAL